MLHRTLGEPGEFKSSMIATVWLFSKSNPMMNLVYALLDTQRDTTFVLEETTEKIGVDS